MISMVCDKISCTVLTASPKVHAVFGGGGS